MATRRQSSGPVRPANLENSACWFWRETRCAVAFGGLRTSKEGIPDHLGDALLRLGADFGIQKRKILDIAEECLARTEDFEDLIRASGAREHVARNLTARVWGRRYRIQQALREARSAKA